MLKKILEFLGGKKPQIFDADGNVQHNFEDQQWSSWNKRYSSEEEHRNWKLHTGNRRKVKK